MDKVVIMLCTVPIWFAVVVSIESFGLSASTDRAGQDAMAGNGDQSVEATEDGDVVAERERINGFDSRGNWEAHGNPPLVISHVRKVYFPHTSKAKVAVADMCVSVGEGHILGLCGQNGAGKSTTQSICVGTLAPSSGRVAISGMDLFRDRGAIYSNGMIGFCPQGESLFPHLTGREILEFFTECRGYAEEDKEAIIQDTLHSLGLRKYAHQVSS